MAIFPSHGTKTYVEQEDALGRHMCYRDGVHVPCPTEAGPASEQDELEPPGQGDLEQQVNEELDRYSIEDLKAALKKMGGRISDSRAAMQAQLADMALRGDRPPPSVQQPSSPPHTPKKAISPSLMSRVAHLAGKPLSGQARSHYGAVFASLSLPELYVLRDSVAGPLSKPEPTHEYGCLMAVVPPAIARQIVRWSKTTIHPDDLGSEGIEEHPHVTIKYGFEDDPDVLEKIHKMLRDVRPFSIWLGRFASFPDKQGKGSPLYLEVESETLMSLNARFTRAFETHDTYPTYIPHLCVAYVNADVLGDYEDYQDLPFQDIEFVVDTLEWSAADGSKETIRLRHTLSNSPLARRKSFLDQYAIKAISFRSPFASPPPPPPAPIQEVEEIEENLPEQEEVPVEPVPSSEQPPPQTKPEPALTQAPAQAPTPAPLPAQEVVAPNAPEPTQPAPTAASAAPVAAPQEEAVPESETRLLSQRAPSIAEFFPNGTDRTNLTPDDLVSFQQLMQPGNINTSGTNLLLTQEDFEQISPMMRDRFLSEQLLEPSVLPGMLRLTLKGAILQEGGIPPADSPKNVARIARLFRTATNTQRQRIANYYGIMEVPRGPDADKIFVNLLQEKLPR